MRTAVYVDGFNLFHRLLEGQPNLKWLDPTALAKACLRDENEIDSVPRIQIPINLRGKIFTFAHWNRARSIFITELFDDARSDTH